MPTCSQLKLLCCFGAPWKEFLFFSIFFVHPWLEIFKVLDHPRSRATPPSASPHSEQAGTGHLLRIWEMPLSLRRKNFEEGAGGGIG